MEEETVARLHGHGDHISRVIVLLIDDIVIRHALMGHGAALVAAGDGGNAAVLRGSWLKGHPA